MAVTNKAKSARNWINQNSTVITIAAVVLLLLSLGVIVSQSQPPTIPILDVYYYDLNTGRLFTAKSDDIPPIEAPSGPQPDIGAPAGVRAYVFSCGECNEKERWIGYLEMYTPDVKAVMASDDPERQAELDMEFWEMGHLIAAIPDPNAEPAEGEEPLVEGEERALMWVPAEREEGYAILGDVDTRCGETQTPRPCMPK